MAAINQQLLHIVRAPNTGARNTQPGQALPGPVVGSVRITFASGGMVTGVTGMVGVSAARAATGVYSLTFPQAPSGGNVKLFFGSDQAATGMGVQGIENFQLTGAGRFVVHALGGTLINPVANDTVNVLFYYDPVTNEYTVP